MIWFVYIVRCADGTLYTGITTDVARRVGEHSGGGLKSAKYLRGRSPLDLVYSCRVGTHSQALVEERRIKRMTRVQKWRLIEKRRSRIAE